MLKEKGKYYRIKYAHSRELRSSAYKVLGYLDRKTSPTPSSVVKCEDTKGNLIGVKSFALKDYPINNRFMVGQACRTPKGKKIYMYVGDEGVTTSTGLRKRMEKFVDTKNNRYEYFEVGYLVSAQDRVPSFNEALEWLKGSCEESLL